MSGKKAFSPDGQKISDVGTFEGFCQAIGLSYSKVLEDLQNLEHFGEAALQNLSQLGVGYRELRQFRRLPDDQKTALIEVAKSGDKDAFLELAEDMIAKHAKEKAALTQRADEAEADLAASRDVSDQKNSKIDQITEELAKVKKRVKALPPADVGEEIRQEAALLASQAEVSIRAMRAGLLALAEHTEVHGISHEDFMAGLLCQVEVSVKQLRGEFGVKEAPDGEEVPDWLRGGETVGA